MDTDRFERPKHIDEATTQPIDAKAIAERVAQKQSAEKGIDDTSS